MADQLFIWSSNFCLCWSYHVRVQDYLQWCPARLTSSSCSFVSYLSITFHQLWAFPLKSMPMTPPCTMSTANSRHAQHIQLYRRRSISPESGLNLGMANSVMQRRGSCRPTKIFCVKHSLQQWKDMRYRNRKVTETDNHRHLEVVLSDDLKRSTHARCIMAGASKRARSDGATFLSLWHQYFMFTIFVLCWNMPAPWVARLSLGRGRNVLGTDVIVCTIVGSINMCLPP